MATKKSIPVFQLGDRVKIHHSDWRGRIVEFRGPLGRGGKFVYRVRIPDKPKPIYIELPEDEMTAIPPRPKKKPSPSASQAPETVEPQGDGPALPKATTTPLPLFRAGDRVKIRDTKWRGRVIELRIPSAPGPVYIYRVRVAAEPRSIYIELPETYLQVIPTPPKRKRSPSGRRRVREEGRKQ